MLYIKGHYNSDNGLEIKRANGLLGALQVELRYEQMITNSHNCFIGILIIGISRVKLNSDSDYGI